MTASGQGDFALYPFPPWFLRSPLHNALPRLIGCMTPPATGPLHMRFPLPRLLFPPFPSLPPPLSGPSSGATSSKKPSLTTQYYTCPVTPTNACLPTVLRFHDDETECVFVHLSVSLLPGTLLGMPKVFLII